jgi:riboflavin kinase/FMN adenylyltransferase
MSFAPHPRTFFHPEKPRLAIYPWRVKARMLEAAGVDILYIVRFDKKFSEFSADAFVNEILKQKLGAKHVVTGENFVFGHKRGGNAETLKASGIGHTTVKGLADNSGQALSSSRIRNALAAGDVAGASALLARPYSITGRVRHGDGRGKKLGFPTANISVHYLFLPAPGVYAVRVHVNEKTHYGVANIGTRPTVGGAEPLLEAHLFDFDGNLYGKPVEVELLKHIRPERRFEGLEALQAQIAKDAENARGICREAHG